MADRALSFRYHPDPVRSGSAVESDEPCALCRTSRGLVYDGPIYGREIDALCLPCIASGIASAALAVGDRPAEFTDVGWGVPEDVPPAVLDKIAHRTPGFHGWQQEHWLYHCADAAAFLGRAGYEELRQAPEALEMVLRENDEFGWSADQSEAYVRSLYPEGDATAYLFRCLHCERHLAYTDMS